MHKPGTDGEKPVDDVVDATVASDSSGSVSDTESDDSDEDFMDDPVVKSQVNVKSMHDLEKVDLMAEMTEEEL